MNAEQNQIDDRRVLEMVRALFSDHGVRLEPNGEWLVGDKGHAFSASTTVHAAGEDNARTRLDIDVSLPGGRLITESFAGVGENIGAALNDAMRNFAINSLHVFLTAFFGSPAEDQVTVETWESQGTYWQAVIGNFGYRGSAEIDMPNGLFERIEEAIRASELKQDIHWFRVFYGQVNGETVATEYLMDNLPWAQAEDALSGVQWVKNPEFYTIRNFIAVLRDPPELAQHLDKTQALNIGLDIVVRSWTEGDIGDADLYRRLTNMGIDGETAERLIIFVPLGFSNVLLSGAELPTTYSVINTDGKPGAEQRLDTEPAFRLARERARQSSHDVVAAVASRCALVHTATKLVGSIEELSTDRVKDLGFTPPAVFYPRFSPPRISS